MTLQSKIEELKQRFVEQLNQYPDESEEIIINLEILERALWSFQAEKALLTASGDGYYIGWEFKDIARAVLASLPKGDE